MRLLSYAPSARFALLLSVLVTACGGAEESPPAVPEQTAWGVLEREASFPEGFTYLGGVREKSDGSLLVADPPGQVLVRLDLEAGTADTLGREGQGPGEYRFPDWVFPLPADSSLLVDLGNGRLGVLAPDDVFADHIPMARSTEDGGFRSLLPRGVDGAGHLYLLDGWTSDAGPPDSVRVLRFRREGGPGAFAAWTWRPEPAPYDRNAKRPMLTAQDAWSVGDDGSVAVARANGLAVDWYRPDGTVVVGPRYDVERFPVGPAEREAELSRMMAGAIVTTSVANQDGIQSSSMRRGVPPGAGFTADDFAWPEQLPLLRYDGTFVTPWGDAWVTRALPQAMAPRVEVFDDVGRWTGHVRLPPDSRVVGFGSTPSGDRAVYLVQEDEMGLQRLSRHRIRRADTSAEAGGGS